MQLLGQYQSGLADFFYQELLKLLEEAFAQGDYAANSTFSDANAQALVAQSQQFDQLALPTAGVRVTDDSLNNPVALLAARLAAIAAESDNFQTTADALLDVVRKDSALVDQLLAAASLEAWALEKPTLTDATRYQWDFGMGAGSVAASDEVEPIDPANLVAYTTRPPVATYLDVADGSVSTGIAAPATITTIPLKGLSWALASAAPREPLYGPDWAELDILEDRPLIKFGDKPHVDVLLPLNAASNVPFDITGSVLGGSLPIYVRVLFTERRSDANLISFNSLFNPSFEAGTVGWTLGAGWTISTNVLVHGPGCTSCAHTASTEPLVSSAVGVSSDQLVFIEGYVATDPGTDGTMTLSLALFEGDGVTPAVDTNGNPIVIALPPVAAVGGWQKISGLVTIPRALSIKTAALEFLVTGQTTGTWYVDDTRIHVPITVSSYQVPPDSVAIYNDVQVFEEGLEGNFVVNSNGQITLLDMADAQLFFCRFSEFFPAYQCSVNQVAWSPVIMLDPLRPYPDDEEQFLPIAMGLDTNAQRTLFPLTDELGNATGMYLRLTTDNLQTEYLLLVTTPVILGTLPGETATLTIEFGRSAYMNGFSLAPFSTFPLTLTSVDAESFSADTRQNVYSGRALVDRPLTLRFPRRLVQKLYLEFFQESYSFKQHTLDQPDSLRRTVIARLQAVLPLNVQRLPPPIPRQVTGAQYDFGVENLAGQDWLAELPGVFTAGPLSFYGIPEVIRLDADIRGQVDAYLCFRAFDGNGVEVDIDIQGAPRDPATNASLPFVPGTALVFPFAPTLTRATVARTDIYLKFVNRSPTSLVERYLLQVTSQ